MDAFSRGLGDLGAFPDRAKIEALCMVAEDAAGDADAVAFLATTALDALEHANPERILSLLYVIDAVSKNRVVGHEFQAAAGARIADVVVSAWQRVRAASSVT